MSIESLITVLSGLKQFTIKQLMLDQILGKAKAQLRKAIKQPHNMQL